MVAGDDPNEYYDTGSAETDNLQKANQAEPIVNTDGFHEAPPLITESSTKTISPLTASASSLPDLGEGSPAIVDISKFTTMKILNKRSSSSSVEYESELGLL